MKLNKNFALAFTLGVGLIANANATTQTLAADGQWQEFNVDDLSSVSTGTEWIDLLDSNSPSFGSPLSFTFTIDSDHQGKLTVVDAGFAGDRFQIFNNGQSIGFTSATSNSTDYSLDFSANLTNSSFSSGTFTLAAGSYTITGMLSETLQPFNATNGAVKLETSAVPVPGAFGFFATAAGLLAATRRRA